MAEILTDHEDIRTWVARRAGQPAIVELPDGAGGTNRSLRLVFGQRPINADGGEGPDRLNGESVVSWDEWFSALDDAGLALRVAEAPDGNQVSFEFVTRDAA